MARGVARRALPRTVQLDELTCRYLLEFKLAFLAEADRQAAYF